MFSCLNGSTYRHEIDVVKDTEKGQRIGLIVLITEKAARNC